MSWVNLSRLLGGGEVDVLVPLVVAVKRAAYPPLWNPSVTQSAENANDFTTTGTTFAG